MPTIPKELTLGEFEKRYGREKPYYELWHGAAIQKAMPIWIHGLLQKILMDLLSRAGHKTASEVRVAIAADFHLIPDVIATDGRIEVPYPTTPVEIVIEILSEDDSMSRVLGKCRAYDTWGVKQVYVVDADARALFRWMRNRLEETATLADIPFAGVWSALDQQLQ